jgi:opacity protein-like surface antigen
MPRLLFAATSTAILVALPAGLVRAAEYPVGQENSPGEVKSHKAGAYATVGLGAAFAQPINWSGGNATGSASFGTGFATEVGAGYDFGNNIRAELTYGYVNQPTNQITASGNINGTSIVGSAPLAATYNASTFLLSAYYDIPTNSRFSPYLGGGIGLGVDSISAQSVTLNGNNFAIQSSTGATFAYQAKVGLSYFVDKKTDLFVEGAYQGNTGYSTTATAGGQNVVVNLANNNAFGFRAGARIRF